MLGWWLLGTVTIPIIWHLSLMRNPTHPTSRTVIDLSSADDTVSLVRHVAQHDTSIDVIVERLECIFRAFPPSEECMQFLSLLQQELEGTGGEQEFAVATVFAVAMATLTNPPPQSSERQEETTDLTRSCPSTPECAGRQGREVRYPVPRQRKRPSLPSRRRASPSMNPERQCDPSTLTDIGRRILLPLRKRTHHRRARASHSAPP